MQQLTWVKISRSDDLKNLQIMRNEHYSECTVHELCRYVTNTVKNVVLCHFGFCFTGWPLFSRDSVIETKCSSFVSSFVSY